MPSDTLSPPCHPGRRTRPGLDGLCASCAAGVRASVRRGQSPDEARAQQLIRVEAERAAAAANTAALLALHPAGNNGGSDA